MNFGHLFALVRQNSKFNIASENRDKILHKHVGYTIDNCIRIERHTNTHIIFTAESSAATGAATAVSAAATQILIRTFCTCIAYKILLVVRDIVIVVATAACAHFIHSTKKGICARFFSFINRYSFFFGNFSLQNEKKNEFNLSELFNTFILDNRYGNEIIANKMCKKIWTLTSRKTKIKKNSLDKNNATI